MSCKFKIEFPGLASEHINEAKKAILKYGGQFQLKGKNGTFEIQTAIGKIAGSFAMEGSIVDFVIDKKPFILTCHRIEKEVRKYAGLG